MTETKHVPKVRLSLSGKKIPLDRPRHLTWHELVQRPARVEPRPRTGPWYEAMAAVPAPTVEVEFPEGYRGGRTHRPAHAYSDELHIKLGKAWSNKIERSHPERRKQRNVRRHEMNEDAA